MRGHSCPRAPDQMRRTEDLGGEDARARDDAAPPNGAMRSASVVKEAAEDSAYEAGAGTGSRSLIRTSVRACRPSQQESRPWSVSEDIGPGAEDSPGFEAARGQHECGSVEAGALVTQRQRPMTWTNIARVTPAAPSFVSRRALQEAVDGGVRVGTAGESPDPP